MQEESAGLRERKKQRTREQIVEAAMRLFAERGFEHTTVADIAAEVDIARRTFFAYFPSKEDVVFHDFDATLDSLRARLRGRPAGETAIDALRDWIAGQIAVADFDDPDERCRQQIIRDTPSLKDHDRALFGRLEEVLEEAVASDVGEEPGGLRPRLVAAAAVAAIDSIRQYWEEDDETHLKEMLASGQDPLAVLDEALVFLRGGIAALERQRPGPRRRR